jgi:hypothetical protein
LSSAILYLAIVAIWACVLVPRWLHRAHDTPSEQELPAGPEEAADRPESRSSEESADAGEPVADALEFATLSEQVIEAEARVAWEDTAVPADPAASNDTVASTRFAAVSYSVTEVSVSAAGPGRPDSTAVHDGSGATTPADAASAAGEAGEAEDGRPRPPSRPGPSGRSRLRDPAASRAHVLRARRRMLTMLVALAIATAAATFVGFTAWWAVIPPAGLLVAYLLVLRVATRADAEIARGRAEAHARALAAARERALLARERARLAQPASQPTAEIIDISALALQAGTGDQAYDQYADAEIRAVGD